LFARIVSFENLQKVFNLLCGDGDMEENSSKLVQKKVSLSSNCGKIEIFVEDTSIVGAQ
jgi:hypothetical protein